MAGAHWSRKNRHLHTRNDTDTISIDWTTNSCQSYDGCTNDDLSLKWTGFRFNFFFCQLNVIKYEIENESSQLWQWKFVLHNLINIYNANSSSWINATNGNAVFLGFWTWTLTPAQMA